LNADSRRFEIHQKDSVLSDNDNPVSYCGVWDKQLFPFHLAVGGRQAYVGKIPTPFGLKECHRSARFSSADRRKVLHF